MNDCGAIASLFTSLLAALPCIVNYFTFRYNLTTTEYFFCDYRQSNYKSCSVPVVAGPLQAVTSSVGTLLISSASGGIPFVRVLFGVPLEWPNLCVCCIAFSYQLWLNCNPDFLETAFRLRASLLGTVVLSVHRHFPHRDGVKFLSESAQALL
jgi:hypothetical protein